MLEIQKINLQQIPFLRIFLFYAFGTAVAFWMTWSEFLLLSSIVTLFLLLCIYIGFLFFKIYNYRDYILFLTIFLLGILGMANQLPIDIPDLENTRVYKAVVAEIPVRKGEILQTRVELINTQEFRFLKSSNLRLQTTIWDKDLKITNLEKGDVIVFKGRIQNLPSAYNPKQFDYSSYLKRNGIFYQIFIPSKDFKILSKIPQDAYKFEANIFKIQNFLQSKFKRFISDYSAYQIASAVTFGYKADLSAEILEVFSNTGTIHVLSVSGFHVSLMFGLLTWVLKPMDRLPKGRSLRFLFVLLFIWFYALICGLVPAVLRATLMFSIFLIGYWKNKVLFSVNAVFSSAFLLLVYDPFMLFDIGFQLSYLAVLGILLFVPLLKKLYQCENKYLNNILIIVYVSLSAQLTTTTLAMFYFHQFPTYFLISNLILTIPSTLILYFGTFLVVPWTGFNEILGDIVKKLVLSTYDILNYIDSLPFSSIQGIPFSAALTLLSYIIILLIFLSIRFQKKWLFMISLSLIMITTGLVLHSRLINKSFKGLKVYNTKKELTFAIIDAGSVHLYSTYDSISHKALKFAVHPDLKRYTELSKVGFTNLSGNNKNQSLAIQNDLSLYVMNGNNDSVHNSKILFLRNNTDLPNEINSTLTILDGSNSWKHIHQSVSVLESKNRAYYVLKDNFAYVWKNNNHGKN